LHTKPSPPAAKSSQPNPQTVVRRKRALDNKIHPYL
jgi:hypothetical protein